MHCSVVAVQCEADLLGCCMFIISAVAAFCMDCIHTHSAGVFAHQGVLSFVESTSCCCCCARFAHEGILNCARAIRDDLKRLGLLDQLLLGAGRESDSCAANDVTDAAHDSSSWGGLRASDKGSSRLRNSSSAAASWSGFQAAPRAGSLGVGAASSCGSVDGAAADAAAATGKGSFGDVDRAKGELPDCRGWTLVLTGHSLGGWVL